MSITINLLPPSERRSEWPLTKILAVITVGVFLVLTGMYAFSWHTSWTLERQLADTRNQYELLGPTREKMAAANSKKQQLDVKNNLLINLTKERKSWYAALIHLGTVTPAQVWLTELAAVDKNTLRVKGMASTYPDVAKFLEQFDKNEMFGEPVLLSAEKDNALPAAKFEMTMKFKGL
jgi:type IV pilus assembly protein PilN